MKQTLTPAAPLGAAVRSLRIEKRITQKALALRADIAVSTLVRIERGHSNLVFSTLLKLADALEMPLSKLLFRAAESSNA